MPQKCSHSINSQAIAIRRKLLRWYDLHRRELPWRKTRDSYRIWVSEVMLQQTRVQTVIPFYEKFLRQFPDMETLAAADEQSLLACWSGLGYYSRARNLQKAAQVIMREHGGRFPRDLPTALRLPGIGGYTAPAVLSIAYGIPLPVLDGNVARVLSRLYALNANPGTTAGKRRLFEQADLLLSRRRPGDFNQALMELGATLCLPRQPRCPACPLQKDCLAYSRDQVERYPPLQRKAETATRHFIAALILDHAGRCFLVRRPQGEKRMGGFWELPVWEHHRKLILVRKKKISQDGILLGNLLGHVRHSITSTRLEVAVFAGHLSRRAVPPRERWIAERDLERFPVTTITRKALRLPH